MKLLQKYFEIEKEIFDYFEYKGSWTVYPLDDQTDVYWYCDGFTCHWTFNLEDAYDEFEYSSPLVSKGTESIFRKDDYTMILIDTQCDGNKFATIFDNKKELTIENNKEILEKLGVL